jgi:integrase
VPTGQVVPLARPELQQLTAAAAAFLAQPSLAASTRRSYQQTLDRLERELGAAQLLEDLTVEAVAAVCAAWSRCAPATWNRHVATLGSFVAYCHRHRWLTTDLAGELERRPEPADRTKAITLPELERLWKRDDVAVREKALWRFLYETAARASEALSINVEDVDLDNKRVPGPLQRWRSRLAPPPDRLGPAAPHADRRAPPRPAVPRRPPPPSPPARPPRWTAARRPAGRGCPTTAPRRYSTRPPAGEPSTSCVTARSPTWPSRTPACRC